MTSHTDPTYVVFDGDTDGWAYRYMRGWRANERIDFNFLDAHDLDSMTSRAQSEDYVKRNLKERMRQSSAVIVLIGEKTKNLYRFVRWELEFALDLDLPIVAANLNESREQDTNCPSIIRDQCVLHVLFKMRAIRFALDNWPDEYRRMSQAHRSEGARHYNSDIYKRLCL
ncbi:TIR domain-containing protein [Mesorhizobium sp. B4-1-4]|uniref:TIR domain-containing protein n=1 Tax=Mesorhizobium sp. B4-1-4 TaxID=2589888 RepID=UPI00112C456A|nr:TIR domain-containing protein [Mesorhizobium sp. B4-1-4]UCI32123.1 TIR domain-containing protein [Mesorhizobium sp. B4-1-4]